MKVAAWLQAVGSLECWGFGTVGWRDGSMCGWLDRGMLDGWSAGHQLRPVDGWRGFARGRPGTHGGAGCFLNRRICLVEGACSAWLGREEPVAWCPSPRPGSTSTGPIQPWTGFGIPQCWRSGTTGKSIVCGLRMPLGGPASELSPIDW